MTIKPTAAAKRKVFFSTNLRNATGENSGAHLEKKKKKMVFYPSSKEKRKKKKRTVKPTHTCTCCELWFE